MKNQKPMFADLIRERRSFFGLRFRKVTFIIVCLVFLGTGIMVFRPFGIGDIHSRSLLKFQKQSPVKKMITKIKDLEREISKKQSKVVRLLVKYKEKTGKELSYLNLLNLSPREKTLLENRIKNEKRISVKALLEAILKKTGQISNLQKRVTALEGLMPKPVVVSEGQNHHQIVMNYLMKEKGLDEEMARQVLDHSFLFAHLIPGFKVWNFFDGKEFGTFVTQGNAEISPGMLQ